VPSDLKGPDETRACGAGLFSWVMRGGRRKWGGGGGAFFWSGIFRGKNCNNCEEPGTPVEEMTNPEDQQKQRAYNREMGGKM